MRLRVLVTVAVLTAAAVGVGGSCSSSDQTRGVGSLDGAAPGCVPSQDVVLTAAAAATVEGSTLRVFGTTNAPQNVTVRAVVVAGVDVPLTTFNFRGWSVDLGADLVTALARSGVATIPVIAYTSDGCVSLQPPLSVRVPSDAAVEPSDGPGDAGTDASDGAVD